MISLIAYVLFSALGIVVLTGIVIIIRNSIRITAAYKFFKNKLKPKSRVQPSNINSVKLTEVMRRFRPYKSEEINSPNN